MMVTSVKLIATVILATSILCAAQEDSEKQVQEALDAIYFTAGRQLYNQDALIQTQEFQTASLPVQQDMQEAYFHQQRMVAYFQHFTKGGYYAFGALILGFSLYKLRTLIAKIPTVLGIGGLIAFNPLIISLGTDVINKGKNFYNAVNRLYFSTGVRTILEQYEIEYVRNKPSIQPVYQNIIEKELINTHTTRTRYQFDNDGESQTGLDHSLRIVRTVLDLPRIIKPIAYDKTLTDQLLVGYTKEALQKLKRYCIRHVAASSSQDVRKIAAYFEGPPGVGKTRAAQLIARSLHLPCEIIPLGSIGDIGDLIGTRLKPGLLLEILSRHAQEGVWNLIVLLDDADRIITNAGEYRLVSFILTLLEPETKSFFSPFLQTNVDISHIGFILTGNIHIDDDALRNRLYIVTFEPYDTVYKTEVVQKELLPSILEQHKNTALSLDQSDLNQRDMDAIHAMIAQDNDPGFRSLKLKLMEFIESKILCKYFLHDDSPELCLPGSSESHKEHFEPLLSKNNDPSDTHYFEQEALHEEEVLV